MYSDFNSLKNDYKCGKVDFEEYKKYFSKLLGTENPGYPDFTKPYFEDMNAQIDVKYGNKPVSTYEYKKTVNKEKKECWVIIETECDEYGEPVRVASRTWIVKSKKVGLELLNRLQIAFNGTFMASDLLFAKNIMSLFKLMIGRPSSELEARLP